MEFLSIVLLHCGPSVTTMGTHGLFKLSEVTYYNSKSCSNSGINSSRFKGKMSYFFLHVNVYL